MFVKNTKMSGKKENEDNEQYEIFKKVVIPLIQNHPELYFDQNVADCLNNGLHKKYKVLYVLLSYS